MCTKCVSKGLECSGLGIRHRFNDGMAARGKWAGKTVQAVHAKSTCAHDSSAALPSMVNSEAGPLEYVDAPCTEHSCAAHTMSPRNTRFQTLSSSPARESGNDHEQREISQHEANRTSAEDQQLDMTTLDKADHTALETTSPKKPTNKSGGVKSSGLSASNSGNPGSAILCQPVLGNMPLWKKMLLLNCKLKIPGSVFGLSLSDHPSLREHCQRNGCNRRPA